MRITQDGSSPLLKPDLALDGSSMIGASDKPASNVKDSWLQIHGLEKLVMQIHGRVDFALQQQKKLFENNQRQDDEFAKQSQALKELSARVDTISGKSCAFQAEGSGAFAGRSSVISLGGIPTPVISSPSPCSAAQAAQPRSNAETMVSAASDCPPSSSAAPSSCDLPQSIRERLKRQTSKDSDDTVPTIAVRSASDDVLAREPSLAPCSSTSPSTSPPQSSTKQPMVERKLSMPVSMKRRGVTCDLQSGDLSSLASVVKVMKDESVAQVKKEMITKKKTQAISKMASERLKEEAADTLSAFQRFVFSPAFDSLFGCLIVANAVVIGVTTNYASMHLTEDPPPAFSYIETSFCILFSMELLAKLMVSGKHFIIGADWKWNVFDLVLVVLAIGEEVMKVFKASVGINLTFLRILRIFRLVRIMRIIRVLSMFSELRVMIASIQGCLKSLLWAVMLLIVIKYVVGVFLTQAVAEYRADNPEAETNDILDEFYGSVARSLLSLYMAMSGGQDWYDLAEPLVDSIGWFYGPFYAVYIAFACIAVSNVITGVFVNEAMDIASKDQESIITEEINREGSTLNEFRRMFVEADQDSNGMLSWEEFECHLSDPRVKAYFKTLGLQVGEAESLFKLLDLDGTGEIDLEQFVMGCSKLKGSAKNMDFAMLMYENQNLMTHMRTIMKGCKQRLEMAEKAMQQQQQQGTLLA